MSTSQLIGSALDAGKADIIIHGANLVNVCTREIYRCDVVIKGNKIARVGEVNRDQLRKTAAVIIEAEGLYLSPGLIDAHLHLESSMLTVREFSRTAIPHGTTSVVLDPHEIVNVVGVVGIQAIIDEAGKTPLRVFLTVPSCVPSAPSLETSGAELTAEEVEKILKWSQIHGLGEVMNYPAVLNVDRSLLRKIEAAKDLGKVIDGHAPLLSGASLNAYVSSGVGSDHESTTEKEIVEKLRLGMHLMLREGSASKNLSRVLKPFVREGYPTRRCMLVTDDLCASDLLLKGHMDFLIRRAVEEGIDPVDAFQMATINPAEYFGLDEWLGSVAPGKRADLILFKNLEKPRIRMTFIDGRTVAKGEEILHVFKPHRYREKFRRTFHLQRKITAGDIATLSGKSGETRRIKIIQVFEDQLITGKMVADLPVVDGHLETAVAEDILKVVVVERHKRSGNAGVGFVKGFGLRSGCIASSVAHDSHNIVAVGTSDEDIAFAVNRIVELQGGLVVVNKSKILGELQLRICGLMSEEGIEAVVSAARKVNALAKRLGCHLNNPFMTLSFLTLPVIPELKITDKGLVDVERASITSLYPDCD